MNETVYALYDSAEKLGLLYVLEPFGDALKVKIPLSQRFCDRGIEEMQLSVRSVNGLMRAGANTVGKLVDVIMGEEGLEKVRNLGKKSVGEIKTFLTVQAYDALSGGEKLAFWNDFLKENGYFETIDQGGNDNA